MEVLMGIFVKACVAVAASRDLPGWSDPLFKKERSGRCTERRSRRIS